MHTPGDTNSPELAPDLPAAPAPAPPLTAAAEADVELLPASSSSWLTAHSARMNMTMASPAAENTQARRCPWMLQKTGLSARAQQAH